MKVRSINDAMWHWVVFSGGKPHLMTTVGDSICLAMRIPETPEYDEDVWMWCERAQTAIWGIVGANGVFQ